MKPGNHCAHVHRKVPIPTKSIWILRDEEEVGDIPQTLPPGRVFSLYKGGY
ncbi:hypothetical protein BBOR36S_04958 [Brevibacillus borstelensis]|jgi:hypothetical protein